MHGTKLRINSKSAKKSGEKFGGKRKTSYLCIVRTNVLAIRAESREEQDHIATTPF